MKFRSAARAAALALMLCGGLVAPAAAQSATADAQKAAPQPKPDAGTTAQLDCIDENDGYVESGKAFSYTIRLANKCEARMRCEVFAYVVQSKGPSSGHAVMILAPASKGEAAKKSHAVKVRQVGGLSQVSRECRVF